MSKRSMARMWFGLTALVVFVGIVVQLYATASSTGGHFTQTGDRVLNVFAFFTVQANVIVGVTSALLAVRTTRRSMLFRTLRLDGVLAIAVTGVVFHTVLRQLQDLSGAAAVADFLLHTASPVLSVGWLLFGPRGQVGSRVVRWALAFPLAWLAFTLLRGPLVRDFYPYPFLDVPEHGYPRVLLNCAAVAVLFLALAVGATVLDRVLTRRSAPIR